MQITIQVPILPRTSTTPKAINLTIVLSSKSGKSMKLANVVSHTDVEHVTHQIMALNNVYNQVQLSWFGNVRIGWEREREASLDGKGVVNN
jgi:hypothetical protein